ncbi:uncharacterized protein LOC123564161 [Mercenaria mercenaria]|uniref:uncharacterized protein LOC123564161 n=1 Tax=Mercenaria mercenaria TaxID=6596 RepID=UPI00234EC1F0|nr:uncharacterized protein LOC123564161 [Mercenaria mercenaria]
MALKFYQSLDIKEKDFDELFCTECTRNGSSVDILNFCVGCESLFCFQCLQDHRRDDTSSEWMVDEDNISNVNNWKLEKNNNRYSKNTNQTTQQLIEIKEKLLTLQKQLQNHSEHDQAECENRLRKVKEHVDRKITDLKTNILDWLEEFRTYTAVAIEEFHHEIEKAYSEKTMSVKILMAKSDATLVKLQNAKTKSDVDDIAGFTEQTQSEARRILEDPDNHYARILKKITAAELENANAIFSESMEEFLGNINALGKCLIEDNSSEPREAVCKFYDVTGPEDTSICDINGSCVMSDGSILLTDWNNTNIKYLNQTYQLTNTCDLPGIPWAICCSGRDEVAVSLHFLQKIQFVSLNEGNMKLTFSFKVNQKCRGVACAGNKIFVSCGGGGILEGRGQVHMFTREGTILKTFKLDTMGRNLFSCPQHMTVSDDGEFLYTADKHSGVVRIDLQMTIPAEIYLSAVESKTEEAKGICLIGDSDIVMCDFILNTVDVHNNIERDGASFQTLLDRNDDICNPQSLCYNRNKKQLVVTSGNTNFIQVFDMETE